MREDPAEQGIGPERVDGVAFALRQRRVDSVIERGEGHRHRPDDLQRLGGALGQGRVDRAGLRISRCEHRARRRAITGPSGVGVTFAVNSTRAGALAMTASAQSATAAV